MTDGAGKTNRWTLKQLRHRIDWEEKPTAIQTRVYGTKVSFPYFPSERVAHASGDTGSSGRRKGKHR